MFNLISKKKATAALMPLVKAVQQLQYQVNRNSYNQGFTIYGYGNQDAQIAAYANIVDLYAIVNKIMKTAALIPIYEYIVTDDKAYGQFKLMQRKAIKNPTNRIIAETRKLQTKALELVGEGSPLQQLLDNPNTFQAKTEFYQLTYLFKLLAGNYYIYKNTLQAGGNMGKVYEMYNMPPNYTFPVASNDIPRRCDGFRSSLYNINQSFTNEEIIHGKYANPIFDFSGNELIGLSPLQAAHKTLTTVSNEIDYANQALKNAGAGGVIVNNDPAEFSPEALGQMKDDVLRELGSAFNGTTNLNANKLAFLAGNWNYLKIFIDPANMQLLEQSRHTFKKLCNAYGVSDLLFNNEGGAKYDNYDMAVRELYTNAALPLVSSLCDDLNRGLAPMYGTTVINYDISDIPELQESQDAVIKRFSDSPGFKPNDLREAQGFDRDLGPDGETFFMKQGYISLSELAMPVDTDLSQLNDNNANDYAR